MVCKQSCFVFLGWSIHPAMGSEWTGYWFRSTTQQTYDAHSRQWFPLEIQKQSYMLYISAIMINRRILISFALFCRCFYSIDILWIYWINYRLYVFSPALSMKWMRSQRSRTYLDRYDVLNMWKGSNMKKYLRRFPPGGRNRVIDIDKCRI